MKQQMLRQAKAFARTVLHQYGALGSVRYWNRDAYRILMYHDFPAIPGLQESLSRQCAHLKRHYKPVTMTDIGLYLKEGRALPKNALAVTVDDGNRDFFVNGYPVFKKHQIPVTVYVVSGFLDGKLWLWWDQTRYMVEHSRQTGLEIALLPGQPKLRLDISTETQREKTISILTNAIKTLRDVDRLALMHGPLSEALQVKIPLTPPPHMAPMRWSELREIIHHGVDIGAHTETHPVLSMVRDPQALFQEVDLSKRRIEEELKRPADHFCYPYGLQRDFNEATVSVVKQCGFQTSVTAIHGMNDQGSDPFRLLRLSVDPLLPELYFRERVAGMHVG